MCTLLADRRRFDVELCAAAGMLHDLSTYETGDPTGHARHSASRAQELLAEMGDFSPDETGMIADADLLHHYLYNPSLKDDWEKNAARLKALLVELSIIDR